MCVGTETDVEEGEQEIEALDEEARRALEEKIRQKQKEKQERKKERKQEKKKERQELPPLLAKMSPNAVEVSGQGREDTQATRHLSYAYLLRLSFLIGRVLITQHGANNFTNNKLFMKNQLGT